MTYPAVVARSPRSLLSGGLGLLVAAGGLGALALGLSRVLYRYPPTPLIVVGFAVALLGALALSLVSFDLAITVGVFLLAAVRFQPAPADLLFAVVITVGVVTGRVNFKRIPWGAALLVWAFLTLNLVSAIDVQDPVRAASFFAITLYVALFGLWLATYVTSSAAARRVTRAYVIAAVASAVVASLALFLPFPGAHLFTRIGRAEGLFKDPNVFGPFLVPAALIVLEEILAPRLFRTRRSVKLAAFAALSLGVLFSYSRAAWLNLGVGVLVVLTVIAFRRGGGRQAGRALAVVLAAAASVTAAVAFSGSTTFLEQRAKLQSYDASRFGAQDQSIHWAEQYPFGLGPGQFERYAGISVHSTYARALAEEGLPGLALMLALVLATFAAAGRNALEGRDTYGIGSAALLGAWCGIVVNSLFVDTLHWRHLWFVAALIWAGSGRATRAGPRPAGRPGG
jgi:O-antigen ligase